MINKPKFSSPEWESAQLPISPSDAGAGFYDGEPQDEDDLWFLPAADTGDLDFTAPLPQADRRGIIDIQAWAEAEAKLVAPLAHLALQQGIFIARMGQGPEGWQQRLALREAVDLSWLAGDRVPLDRLTLWMALRLTGDGDDHQALARASWSARRLTEGAAPDVDLAGFLGRHDPGDQNNVAHQMADWQDVMGQAAALHPITRSALGFHIWPLLGLSAGHALGGAAPLPLMEAAVVAARRAVPVGMQAPFLPMALGGAAGFQAFGTVEIRLQRWIAGAMQGVRAGLRMLDQLAAWEAQAKDISAALSGRTPPQLITLLCDWPLVSAAMAEAQTSASRAAVQRNLNWMTTHGIAREITGQGRYRFWQAAL